ncbi:hypothetical protein SAICODRAFT_193379 [Saitoella complicata NRRL Y-17804]|uniref:uncharacterized protein n=1 Tax=Saitoella complicata (strain BCRC 22490 / CBS 7301 / JCM 7358 / NBRC 10748 / NRRL Y-17804) TaxID=698492 RepID=UPI000866C0A6|nr:uncharacterized protein SAICODRAFT_193379 [Saitoella complicata NRRL Y-17804]ODQ49738.1 hypothetical protein SAICODRAFT_193379 [Saitoella complicata NRRL Y-17804]
MTTRTPLIQACSYARPRETAVRICSRANLRFHNHFLASETCPIDFLFSFFIFFASAPLGFFTGDLGFCCSFTGDFFCCSFCALILFLFSASFAFFSFSFSASSPSCAGSFSGDFD